MEFTCPRCRDSFKRKDYLIAHLKRKSECLPSSSNETRQSIIEKLTTKEHTVPTYVCEYCTKTFIQSYRSRHTKICKQNPINIQEVDDVDEVQETVAQQIVVDKDEFENMKKKLKEVEEQLKTLTESKASSSSIINNTTHNTININLNSFGNEDTSYLTHDFLSYCLLNPRKGLTSLIENIHYNTDYPSNQNIRCKSLKQNIFEKYIDAEWRACDASNTLDELIRKGYRILNTHYTEHFMNDPSVQDDEMQQKAYERFRYLSDTASNDYHAVKRELRILVKDRTVYIIASPESQTSTDSLNTIISQ